MTDKEQIMIDGVEVLKEKINICFILLLNKLETPETIEQTIYEHLDAFVEKWNTQLARKMQECEELKEENEELNKRNNFLLRRLEVDDNDTSLVFKLQNELQQKSNEFYHAVVTNVKFSKEVDRYRKALEEIERYCKNVSVEENLYNSRHFYNGGVTVEVVNEILDIINKVKGVDNE